MKGIAKMIHLGLVFIGAIQIFTAISTLFSNKTGSILGIPTLRGDFALYRHMLTALWLSVGIIYLVGAFNSRVIFGASLLAILNSIFEIVGYWNSKLPLWYKNLATFGMLLPIIFITVGFVQQGI